MDSDKDPFTLMPETAAMQHFRIWQQSNPEYSYKKMRMMEIISLYVQVFPLRVVPFLYACMEKTADACVKHEKLVAILKHPSTEDLVSPEKPEHDPSCN